MLNEEVIKWMDKVHRQNLISAIRILQEKTGEKVKSFNFFSEFDIDILEVMRNNYLCKWNKQIEEKKKNETI